MLPPLLAERSEDAVDVLWRQDPAARAEQLLDDGAPAEIRRALLHGAAGRGDDAKAACLRLARGGLEQARLAKTRFATDDDGARRTRSGVGERGLDHLQLGVATDERRPADSRGRRGGTLPSPPDARDVECFRLPLQLHAADRLGDV